MLLFRLLAGALLCAAAMWIAEATMRIAITKRDDTELARD